MISIADPELAEAERERVDDVLESGMLADGPEERTFEEEVDDIRWGDIQRRNEPVLVLGWRDPFDLCSKLSLLSYTLGGG